MIGLLVACREPDPVVPEALLDVEIEASVVVPTVHEVRFGSTVEGIGHVEVTDARGTWSSAPTPSGTSHTVRLLGLAAGETVDWRPIVETVEGVRIEGSWTVLDVPPAPPEMPAFTVEIPSDDRFWVLVYTIGSVHSFAVIVDQDGHPVWWTTGPDPTQQVAMAKPSVDGEAIWTGHFQGAQQGMKRTPLAAMSADEVTFRPTREAHHDFVELPDGKLGHLAHDYRTMTWGELGERPVQIDQIAELGDDGRSTVVFDAGLALPDQLYPVCRHSVGGDWAHANSLVYDPLDDTYLMNLRNLDVLLKVSRATGALVWQLGGADSDFGLPPDDRFAHAHFSVWDDGRLYLFSNELHDGPSRLMAYTVDGESRTAGLDWSYVQPEGRTVGVLGDLDPLPSGNLLAAWGALDTVEQITAEGTVAWRVVADDGTNLARA